MRLRELWPDIRVLGIGGERMRDAGVEVFSGYASAIGLVEALSAYRDVRKTYEKTVSVMETERPDVVVLIDYPDFNFRVGAKARELGCKVLYYVSPQLWAWRSGRINVMKEFVDRAAVLLPFEPGIYKDAGIPCEFVGHPVIEEMAGITEDKRQAKLELGLEAEKPYLALLPGSRNSELRSLLPVMLDTVRRLKAARPGLGFVLSLAPNLDEELYIDQIRAFEKEGVVVSRKNAVLLYTASEAAVVASGTAALQGVFRGTPLVIIYRVNPVTYLLIKMLAKVKYVNLANLILDREAVPELLQGRADPALVAREISGLLENSERRKRMLDDLEEVREMFVGKRPTERVALMVGELVGWAS
jgi:lipid-A-disaccharide synthase